MYIIFLDESGQPGGFDKDNNKLVKNTSKYFVLAGFIINADDILKIEKCMKDIKIKYGLNPLNEVKWHTTYSKLKLSFEQYKNMKLEITREISKYKNSVIGIVMDKENCYKNKYEYIKNHNDLYATALHLLMERCSMQIANKFKKRDNLKPAMLIADSRKNDNNNKLDKELQIAYLRAKNMGTHFIKFPNFCESIVLVDSNYYSGVQFADFCAGAIYKKYENGNSEFFEELKPAIRKHHNSIYGAGIKLY